MRLFFSIGVILFMFSFLFGCSSFGYQSPRYVKLAHEITEKTAKELKMQKNLYLIGTGGQMMEDWSITLAQILAKRFTRRLMSKLREQFLLNKNFVGEKMSKTVLQTEDQ